MKKLNVQSIFNSIDGEVNGFHGAGEMCTFIRLKGCNLNCHWCDTKYAKCIAPKRMMTINKILEFPKLLSKITITGGEPFLQREEVMYLIQGLLFKGCRITIETNGSYEPPVDIGIANNFLGDRIRYVMDYKLPSSGMEEHMDPEAFESLRPVDVIKFVIANHSDYFIARDLVVHRSWKARKVFSPLMKNGNQKAWATELAEMILDDYETLQDVQLSLQLHKILWPNAKEEK